MRAAFAVLFALALAHSDAREDVPNETKGQHVTLTVRCDPPAVLPGGWVDVVIGCEIDPGWHTTSPRSKAGQRTLVEVTAPAGSVLTREVLAKPGRVVHDETFGDVEQISGRVEFRQRLRLPQNGDEGSRAIEGSVTIVVCDFAHCLPPQTLRIRAPLEIRSKNGLPGPQLDDELVLDANEVAKLADKGFLVRASTDVERAKPGEDFLLIVDIVLGADTKPDDVSLTSVGDATVSESGHGWTISKRTAKGAGLGKTTCSTRVIQMRVATGTKDPKHEIPIVVHYRTKSGGGVMDVAVPLAIDP